MEWTEIAIGIVVAIFGVYYWSTSTYDYWTSRGITGPSPKPFVGNMAQIYLGKSSIGEYLASVCVSYQDEAMFGIFIGREPALVLTDPELIQDVFVKDFSSFTDRDFGIFDKVEALSQNLFDLEGARWRPLRTKLSTAFGTGKIKKMFHLLLACGNHFAEYLTDLIGKSETVECTALLSKFTTDSIGSCIFGIQFNAHSGKNSPFTKLGDSVFKPDRKQKIMEYIRFFLPSLYSLIGPLMTDWELTNLFMGVMRDTIDYRKKNGIVRHDFFDIIMDMRVNPEGFDGIELTDTFLAAQFYTLVMAGYESSALTISHVLYELAQNHTVQDKVRKDINDEMAKMNGELNYECIKSMKYLHMLFQESLRKYPPGYIIMRRSTKEYTFAGTKLTLPKGLKIIIPVLAIHHDPRIYPKPEVFCPERFTDKAIEARHAMHWLGFGKGPRNCIASHFAYYQSKVGLIKILQNYKADVCDKTQIPYISNPLSFILSPSNGIHVKLSKLN